MSRRTYSRHSFFEGISGAFRRLSPLVRYPIVGVSAFLGLLPAVAFFYGLLVGMEFTARYSIRQAYCAICDEGAVVSSRITPPASCREDDSEQLAHQTVRNVFAPENGSAENHD